MTTLIKLFEEYSIIKRNIWDDKVVNSHNNLENVTEYACANYEYFIYA